MINVSDTVKSAFKSDEFVGGVTFTVGNNTYTARNILNNSTAITESIASGDDIDFRAVEKSCLETTLINITENIKELKGKTLTMKQTVLGTEIPLGVYTIDDAINDGDYLYDIVAYDNLYKFDRDVSEWWNTQVVFPISIRNLVISLCTYVGVTYTFPETFTNSEFLVQKNIEAEDMRGTEILGYIQEVCAGFFKPDRTGVMRFIQLLYSSEDGLYPDETLYPDEDLYPMGEYNAESAEPSALYNVPITMEKLQLADYTVQPISKLQIRVTENDVGIVVGDGDSAYVIEGNPIFYAFTGSADNYEVARNILDVITEITYIPVTTKVKALPYIEVGDLIRFVSFEGREAYAPLLNRTLSGFILSTDTISIKGSEKRENIVQAINKTTKILNQRLHEVINTVETFESRILKVETDVANPDEQIISESDLKQTADGIESTVTQTLTGYVTQEQLGTRLSQTATEILASVWSTATGKELLETVANFNKYGLNVTIKTEGGQEVSTGRLTSDGVVVLKNINNQNYIVAKFTQNESYTNNLTVATYTRFGAHRWEAIEGLEYDGVTTMGTAAAWTGPQEELIEPTGESTAEPDEGD